MKAYAWTPAPDRYADYSTLIFANNRQEARVLGFNTDPNRGCGDFIDCRIRLLQETPDIMNQAFSEEPHCVDNPLACQGCGQWQPNGCTCGTI